MIPVSTDYKRELIKGNRNYVIKVDVTLAGHAVPDFTLTNNEIWDNGISLDNAISSDDSFDIGSAIVGSLSVVINNINDDYSQYDFFDATLTLYLGVSGDLDENDQQRYYRIGFYVVDVPTYNGSLITLECLDNMVWFDVPYKEVTGITYPATAQTVVQAMCSHVGVPLETLNFPNSTENATRVMVAPEQDYSCREVLQYIAQMCCCYCKINTAGKLELKWYDKSLINNIIDYDGGTFSTTTTPYSDGCDLDGGQWYWDGDTYVWTQGDEADGGQFSQLLNRVFISNNYDIQVATDDVVITGCRVRNNTSDENSFDVLWVDSTLEQTHDRYVLCIDDNPFILTESAANSIANIVGQTLAGLPIRGFSSTSLSDFSYETGDMATVIDFRGNRYYTWITHTTFTTNNSETFSCGVESLKKRSEQRFSTIAETIEKAKVALSAYDIAVKEMNTLAQNAIGYNEYYYPNVGTTPANRVTYRYNGADTPSGANPKFPNSTVVFKISGDGVFVSTSKDAQGYEQYTNGYDANSGTAILNLLYAQGLNAQWITAGTIDTNRLNVTGIITAINNNGTTYINGGKIATGTMNANRIGAGTIDASVIAVTNLNASNITAGTMSADRITSGTMSAARISGGTLTLGGNDNVNGVCNVKNSSGTTKVKLNSDGITATAGTIAGWTLNSSGFTNGSDAWVKPLEISCGTHGATLVKMLGKSSGTDGYLSVEVNSSSDYVRVRTDGITKKSSGGTSYAVWEASDRRCKKDITDLALDEAQNLITKVAPKKFKFKDEDCYRYGFIAQELRKIIDDDCGIEYGEDARAIHYSDFIAPLCMVVNDQQKQIDLLKQELAELKARID